MLNHWRTIRAACRSLVAVALVMCGIATVSMAVLRARVVGAGDNVQQHLLRELGHRQHHCH